MSVREIGSRIRYIEPTEILNGDMDNPGINGYMSPLEDLCISLNLEAVLSDRNSCGMPNTDGTATRVFTTSFVGKGSYQHGTDGTLTTNFTDATPKNPENNTDECFGIQSVSISYDMGTPGQAFSPNVVIKFVDIRGISVMGKKENDANGSFYRALFMLPSPLFKLSVKGFYGCEITYNLALSHPVKIDFDSSTGNFNITANFKGYMFGIYNDLPMSYAVVAPYMDYVGRDYWDNQIQSGKFTFKNDDTYVPMIKYPEFREKVATATLGEEAKGARSSYDQATSYADKEKTDALTLINGYPLREWKENGGIIYRITETFSESERNVLKGEISDFYGAVEGYDKDKVIHSVKFGDTFTFLKKYIGDNARLIDVFLLIRQEKSKPFVLKSDNGQVKIKYEAVKELLQEELGKTKEDTMHIYAWVVDKESKDSVDAVINKKLQKIDDLKSKAKEDYQKTLNQIVAQALGFPPTVENLFRMMFAHMETFMRVFYNCTGKIKGRMDNNDSIRSINHYKMTMTETDSMNDNGLLPPFPLFVKEKTYDGDTVSESVWAGSLDNGSDLEEVRFVESLVSASKLYSNDSKIVDEKIRRFKNPEDNNEVQNGSANISDDPYKNKDLKHSCYLTLKNLYDRWLCSTLESRWKLSQNIDASTLEETGYKESDFDNFVYIDSFYHNIGQKLIIDSTAVSNLVSKCMPDGGMSGEGGKVEYDNHTVYEYLYEVASGCGGNLMALPVMYGIKDNAALGKLFKVLPYDKKSLGNASMTYVFLYDYKASEQLDTGSEKKDDGFMMTEEDLLPSSLSDNDGNLIPAFGVTYAKQSQAIFKNISFESDKPGITDKALTRTMSIAQASSKGPRETNLYGQDIYGVYSSMQYNCSVEMMGNAQIMPMMYFQLNNIPFWKGTYMITNVSHEISPGDMKTTFKGIRINRNAIPLTEGKTITLKSTDWKIPVKNNNNENKKNNMPNNISKYPDGPVIKISNENDYRQSLVMKEKIMRELGWKDYMAAALIGCVMAEAGGFKPWMVNVGEKSGTLKSSRACYNGPKLSPEERGHYNGAYSYGAGIIQFTYWDRKLNAVKIVAAKNGGRVRGMTPEEFLMDIDGPGMRTCPKPSGWQRAKKADYKGGVENLTLDEQFDVLIGELFNRYPAVNASVKMSTNVHEALAVIYCKYIGGIGRRVGIPTPEEVQKKVTAYMRANPKTTEKDHYIKRLGYAKNFC